MLQEKRTENIERYHPMMRTPVKMIDGGWISADQLARRAHESEYGQYMRESQPLRFAQTFAYANRETMLQDLGHDLDPIGHQKELAWHLAQIIERQRMFDPNFAISDEEIGLLMFTCMNHDMGEMEHEEVKRIVGATVGDIPAGRKTDEDRLIERDVRFFAYDTFYADVDPDVTRRCEAMIAHQPLAGDELLYELYEAAHEIQTLETALAAREISEEIGWYDHGEIMQLIDNRDGRAGGVLGIGRHVLDRSLKDAARFAHYEYIESSLSALLFDEEQAA